MLRLSAEPTVQQLIRRQHVALKIRGNEQPADDESRDQVASDHLQVRQAAALFGVCVRSVGKRGDADERQRARLGRDDRQADHDPRRLTCADEVVPHGRVRAAKAAAEDRDADEVDRENRVVEG